MLGLFESLKPDRTGLAAVSPQTHRLGSHPDPAPQPVTPTSGRIVGKLEVADLALEIPGRRLLSSASLAVNAGGSLAIVGPSGVGKTSLLNCIAGISTPAAGSVTVDDIELSRLPGRLRHIGMVFQFGELLPELSLVENVALPLRLLGEDRRAAEERARARLAEVGLADQAKSRPELLSGGEIQRGAIARALVHDPSLVLADEPTGMLDEDNTGRIVDLLIESTRRAGAALLIVTHNPTVARAADRLMTMRGGQLLVADGGTLHATMQPS